jgi:hypothetical protein
LERQTDPLAPEASDASHDAMLRQSRSHRTNATLVQDIPLTVSTALWNGITCGGGNLAALRDPEINFPGGV